MRSFEEYVKNKLTGYEPEVPAHIWKNIEERKKKRAFFWFFLEGRMKYVSLSLLLLTLGLFRYVGYDEEETFAEKTTSSQKALSAMNSSSKEAAVGSSGKETSELASDDVGSSEEIKEPSPGNKELSPTNTSKFKGNRVFEKASAVADVRRNYLSKEKISKEAFANRIKSTETNEGFANIERLHNQHPDKTISESSIIPNEEFTDDSMNSANKTSRESGPIVTGENADLPISENGEAADVAFTRFYFTPQRLMTRLPSLSILSPQKKNYSIPPCPGELPSAGGKYLELYAGPDLVFTSYSDTSSSNYIDKRKSATEISFAYSAGARFTKVFGNGMSVKTGINFSHIVERFSVLQGNVIQIIYILGPTGDTLGNYATRTSRYIKSHNNYHTIDIPLLMGYEMNVGKWKANLNAGVMMNLYSWQNGLMIDTSGKVVSIKSGSGSQDYQFKTNMGIGFLGSLSLYYPLKDGLYFLAEPYFRYNLASANREEISLRQKFHNSGIRLGLRFDLKNK
jgi:hypothetical protein